MGTTIQVIHKIYCCIENKDKNIFNEDLDDESQDDNEDDKQIIKQINSFTTDINGSSN